MFRFVNAPALVTLTLVTLVLTPSSPPALAATEEWLQVGEDIAGTASITNAGTAVAFSRDGSSVAVASWEIDNTGPGSVRVYEVGSGGLTPRGLTLEGAADGDYFGNDIALSSDGLTLAVGAPFNDSSRGQVFVYTWDGTAWVAKGATLTGSASNVDFGYALSLSDDGNTLAVGSPKKSLATGEVSVVTWDASASPPAWRTPVVIAAEDPGENFGRALELNADGTVVVVGARDNDDGGANSGETRVFALSGGSWTQRGADIPGAATGDRSGHAVAISADGTIIASGAPEHDSSAGHVRAFQWSGTAWTPEGADIDGDAAGDEYGYSVDLSSDGLTLIAGSPERTAALGAIRLLSFVDNSWGELLSLPGQSAAEKFGTSVALSGDGSTFIAGAPEADTVATNSGLARVFRLFVTTDTTASSEESPGVPGIYLHVAGPVGRGAEGSPVYYGSDRVAVTSSYLLTITSVTTNTTTRVLAEGVVDARGNLEARTLLPALSPGTYDVVFQGKHRGGAGLRLTARIAVGEAGSITVLGNNVPQLW